MAFHTVEAVTGSGTFPGGGKDKVLYSIVLTPTGASAVDIVLSDGTAAVFAVKTGTLGPSASHTFRGGLRFATQLNYVVTGTGTAYLEVG